MPPKMTGQHKRDQSPDNKQEKGEIGEKGRKKSDDESTMDKLKEKMGGLFHRDDKDDRNDPKKQNEKNEKDLSRSRSGGASRERRAKNQDPFGKKQDEKDKTGRLRSRSRSQERKGRQQSPDHKVPAGGSGLQQHQQQPTKMDMGAGAGAAAAKNGPGDGQHPGQSQGPAQPGHQQNPGQGVGPNMQRQQPGIGAAARAATGAAGAHTSQKSRTKRGLCWPVENKRDDPSRFIKPSSKVSWLYNWSPHPTKGAEGLQFIPMQWNAGGIGELKANVGRTEAKTLLAFNEPELRDQANMTAEEAAEQWMRFVEPLRRQGVRCGGPAMSNAGHAVGWMQDFWGRIKKQGSDVDFWCLHWYGVDLGPFYDYIWSTHHQLSPTKPVWITEFAATNWNKDAPLPKDVVEKFARESFKYLDSLDWVERYCWFGAMREMGDVGRFARMYGDDGSLTELGRVFRDE